MKIIAVIFVLIVVNVFAINYSPSWYPNEDNSIRSYGKGNTFDEAKINAFDNFKNNNIELSKVTINEIKVTKEEIFENQFFLEIKYNKDTILEQLQQEIKNVVFKLDEQTNKYLLNTVLMKELNKTYGYMPTLNIVKEKLYFNDKIFLMKNSEFENLIFEYYSDDILLDIKMELLENEKYFIKITPKISGFTSLVQIFNNTDVEILFTNKKLEKNTDTIFPNFKMSDGLEINLEKYEDVKEIITLAIICPNKIDFKSFNNIFLPSITNENMLGEFINNIGDCEYTSIFTLIKSNK